MGLTVAEQEAIVLTSSSGSSLEDENFSQASMRTYRIWEDQWGREYGSDAELKTMHPTGPISARFQAPLMPPHKYIVVADAIRGKIWIDTRQWIYDLMEAHQMFWQEVRSQAQRIAGSRSASLYDQSANWIDDDLVQLVGKPPMPLEVIQAMRAGNRWLLGLPLEDGSPAPRPERVPDDYFPTAEQVAAKDPLNEEDPWGEPTVSKEEAQEIAKRGAIPMEYPHHYGGGNWWLSDAHRVACMKDEAPSFKGSKLEAQRAAEIGAIPTFDDDDISEQDPSWG